jgi:hypothetical protein
MGESFQSCCCGGFIHSSRVLTFLSSILFYNSTDPHLIAWFSAGAFVLLGFPMSIYGIVMHLMHYNQPNVQCYVVRILWMVPIYSIESWLCLRYKDYAIYIETLRDWYESYVLYSFLQFLIEVLGGEDALILMLKNKSPTRGVHMWGLQYCGIKPWLMGQPVRRIYDATMTSTTTSTATTTPQTTNTTSANTTSASTSSQQQNNNNNNIRYKRVHWTSPFYVYCKFGVLQYVLLRCVCSLIVVILERNHIYKEGDFTYKGGYLYICILTNLSQCWALYCLIFFYYATKNELSPIRPVGKFLAVKALVFFTWWQSVCISILYQYNLIPHYHAGMMSLGGAASGVSATGDEYSYEPLSQDAALALDEWGGNALPANGANFSASSSSLNEWTSEDVAKGLQDYLICIEMFLAAIVHIFVFSHTEYDIQAVEARERALHQLPHHGHYKRLGRRHNKDNMSFWDNKSAYSGTTLTSSDYPANNSTTDTNNMELVPLHEAAAAEQIMYRTPDSSVDDDEDLRVHPLDRMEQDRRPLLDTVHDDEDDNKDDDGSFYSMASSELNDEEDEDDDDIDEHRTLLPTPPRKPAPSFVKALLDSAIPQDLRDNTVGIIKGEYVVERKTLLHHAATSDSYDLFSRVPKLKKNNTSSSLKEYQMKEKEKRESEGCEKV